MGPSLPERSPATNLTGRGIDHIAEGVDDDERADDQRSRP